MFLSNAIFILLCSCQEDALKWLPDGYRLNKDAFNGRWQVTNRFFTCSRSFLKYGEVASFALAAYETWTFDSECPHLWITELHKAWNE